MSFLILCCVFLPLNIIEFQKEKKSKNTHEQTQVSKYFGSQDRQLSLDPMYETLIAQTVTHINKSFFS